MSLLKLLESGFDPAFAQRFGAILRESIFMDSDSPQVQDRAHVRGRASHEESAARAAKVKQSSGSLYNSHSQAAHSSTARAIRTGTSADHDVAAIHHDHAATTAESCSGLCDEKSKNADDYKVASKYHKAQAVAHRAASEYANRGGMEFTPVY